MPVIDFHIHKIPFGSDWPSVPGIARNIEAIRTLDLKDENKRKILGENAAKILGIR
jgi:predicted TIM-barrel fold metal-dependent hydrolase